MKFKTCYIDLVKDRRKGAPVAFFSFFLLLISFIYGFLVKLMLFCYRAGVFRSSQPDCRVISVGNITWGGTGKTPLVEAVANFLKQEGKKPAILIRGYGKDEVYMLKDKFKDTPVLAGRDRIKTARAALGRYAADTIILDDGFQHWRLKRDLDIVLIDAKYPFGNRRLIPRGILREPLSSLSRADVFVLSKTDLAGRSIEPIKNELKIYNPRAPIYEAVHAPCFLRSLSSGERIELATIKNRRIAVVSGIADPVSFAQSLTSLGAEISLRFQFSDHYRYSKEDLERIEKESLKNGIETIVTTEKDAAKIIRLLQSKRLKVAFYALAIEFKIVKDEERFFRSLPGKNKEKQPYSILILSDGKAGHLNQTKAVAGLIEKRKIDRAGKDAQVDTRIVEVKFRNRFFRLLLGFCAIFARPHCGRCLFCFRCCLQKESFNELVQTPARIIVSAGSALSWVNLFLSYKNKARKVVLMKPSFLRLDRFDLVIVPQHDRIKPRDNVLMTQITPNLIDRRYLEKQANLLKNSLQLKAYSLQLKGPTIGVLIGGDTARYRLTLEMANKIISQLKEAAQNLDCQLLVTTSRRTPKIVEQLLKENLSNFSACKLLVIANEKNIPQGLAGILGLSDVIVVSGESISMVSEAVSAQKYVLVFNPEKKVKSLTKQDRFLANLEKENILKIITPDNLVFEIEKIWQEKPERKNIEDRTLIYQAIGRFLQ